MNLVARILVAMIPLVLVGCRPSAPDAAPHPRLVTFSPALTRIVFDLGLGDHVVGVSTYSRLPAGITRPVVGDTLNIRVEPILVVKPDILLVQMDLSYFESLRRVDPNIRIEHFTIETLEDIADAIARVGSIVGQPDLGLSRKTAFLDKLASLRKRTETLAPVPTIFVLGYRGPSAPGSGTFTDQMITIAGGRNVLAGEFKGWKKPSLESIVKLAPAVIICQCKSEDAADAAAYWKELDLRTPTLQRVIVVTDDDWTLPAQHLADYASQLVSFIHPELRAPDKMSFVAPRPSEKAAGQEAEAGDTVERYRAMLFPTPPDGFTAGRRQNVILSGALNTEPAQ